MGFAGDPTQIDRSKPVVYFGSFQDLLGRDDVGNIKPKKEWLHQWGFDTADFVAELCDRRITPHVAQNA